MHDQVATKWTTANFELRNVDRVLGSQVTLSGDSEPRRGEASRGKLGPYLNVRVGEQSGRQKCHRQTNRQHAPMYLLSLGPHAGRLGRGRVEEILKGAACHPMLVSRAGHPG